LFPGIFASFFLPFFNKMSDDDPSPGSSAPSTGSDTPMPDAAFIPQAEHLANPPVTKISPTDGAFPDAAPEGEAVFTRLVETLKGPIQIIAKKPIEWSKRDPLHFWQSLAFALRSEELTCIAVSSFVDTTGQNKLYIASNDPIAESQKQELTDIIHMFLDLQPLEEIATRLLPRHLPYIVKQVGKIAAAQQQAFAAEYPGELASTVKTLAAKVISGDAISLDDIQLLMDLIEDNREELRAMKDGNTTGTSEDAKKMAYHLCKITRIFDEVYFVWKKIRKHQPDPALASLSRHFQFVSLGCHAELAILKTAKDCCASRTLYIGVSKRPCYCCSLFFKAVQENKSTAFNISIVTTHGKLYGRWNKIEGCFEKEFNQVWAKATKEITARGKHLEQQTDDNSSESDEDYLPKVRLRK
jgi:hypothetical protein